MTETLKLYGGKGTRSTLIEWYLQEMGVSYDLIPVDLKSGKHLEADYLALNPMGKVPALTDGELTLWESGAILLYLASKYDSNSQSLESQGQFYQWVLFANATLGLGIFLEERREKELPRLLGGLNSVLTDKSFLVNNQFTVADVAVGSYLAYGVFMLQLTYEEYPAVRDYIRSIMSRPAFLNTIGQR